jgi:hypothetical protein
MTVTIHSEICRFTESVLRCNDITLGRVLVAIHFLMHATQQESLS